MTSFVLSYHRVASTSTEKVWIFMEEPSSIIIAFIKGLKCFFN
jgi:hypothetical protein